MTHVDLTPLANLAIIMAAAVLAPVGTWLSVKVGNFLHLRGDDKSRRVLETAIQNGITLGAQRAQEAVSAGVGIDVKSATIAATINYVAPKVPDVLKRLNITPENLSEMIEARLATPPPTATIAVENKTA